VPEAPCEWLALRVDVDATAAEAVANFLLEAGAPGLITEEHDEGEAPRAAGRARLEAPLRPADHARVVAALRRYLASLRELDPALGETSLETVRVPSVDWTALYRRHHRPACVGGRLLVAPPWDVPAGGEREVLVIEPGMAFGTGQHATTRGCLEAIEQALDARPIAAALDVGTGSGVLAIALARLSAARVVALDADPAVLPLARRNLVRNGAGHVALCAGRPAALRARFDLVVANLLAETLVEEATELAALVAEGGRLIVSGLLAAQAVAVQTAFPGWRVIDRRGEDGWQTLTLRRAA